MPIYDTTPSNGGTTYTSGNGISIEGKEIAAKLSEDANNAAQFGEDGGIFVPQATASGVTSFNSRTGAVTPQTGDYTAAMVGAADANTTSQALQTLSDEIDNIISGASPVTLPVASETKVGGVKVGSGLSVTADGTLSADSQLPPNGTDGQLLGAGESGATNWVTTDATPTESSANPVQSGGVFNALAGKADLTLSNLSNYQTALRNIGGRPGRNLLDNWYFAGGGSQQGGGQFPINQRGQTSWSQGSAFDRWLISKSSSSDAIVTLSEDGVSASAQCRFFERLDGKDLVGEQLTLSALLDSNELIFGTVTFNQQNSVAVNNGEFSLYMENRPDTTFTVFVISWIKGSGKKVVAAKLELGPTQTLAYQDEDGNWQLFETPDYGEELAKCKRYLQMINTRMLGVGFKEPGNGGVWMSFGFPVEMRVNPTVTVKMLPQFAYDDVTATGTVWTAQTSIGMSCSFALPEGNGITDYRACVARNPGIVFELSAEL